VTAYLLERRFDQAKRILRQSIEANPNSLDSHLILGLTGIYQGNCQEANTEFAWFSQRYPSPVADFGLALGAACDGQKQRARQLIGQAEAAGGPAFVSPYQAAMAWSWLGERNAALENLQKSADAREGQIFYLPYDPAFDAIRHDPRFLALERRVGFE
jgi:tetratricopeptide (TPR) repeat protein